MPDFALPSLRARDIDGVLPLAFACFLLAYIEGVSAARALAQKHGYEIDALGSALGPYLIGAVSDATESLRFAVSTAAGAMALGGLLIAYAGRVMRAKTVPPEA